MATMRYPWKERRTQHSQSGFWSGTKTQTEQSIAEYDGAAVTIEQAGGSAEPTTDPILQG